jgi:hypothetical protein
MLTENFYKIVDKELKEILDKNPEDADMHKHPKEEDNKGYAFLVWFIAFYGQKKLYKNYITDGKGDSSCDIIFSNFDVENQEIYYIVQSKWLNLKINDKGQLLRSNKPIQVFPQIEKEEFNSVIAEFSTVANGSRKIGENEKFNEKYKDLIKHLEKNGKAKFIFFTAYQYNTEIEDAINSFKKEYAPNISFEVIDIERIKRDYIELKFKEIILANPLEYTYNPEEGEIEIEIERYKNGENFEKSYLSSRDFLQFEGRGQAYIFILKPKTIHQLFHKYKFNLFYKNVRNPLHHSNYNPKIVETLQQRPDAFWYFNNGITAITKRIPDVGKNANTFTIKGLQIINGAQTVYSIYQAYENADANLRAIMDTDARISFRLIRSSDENFNMEITRYTNMQNQMEDRDFVANLDEQQRLQLESFKTNYWYEKRRGEFRNNELVKENNIQIISNEEFAKSYLMFHLQVVSLKDDTDNINENYSYLFIKRVDDIKGLYEIIFNKDTKFDIMLASYLINKFYYRNYREIVKYSNVSDFFPTPNLALALSKIVLQKYLNLNKKSNKNVNIFNFILQSLKEKSNAELVLKVFIFAFQIIDKKKLPNSDNDLSKILTKLVKNYQSFYDSIKQEVEEMDLKLEDIDTIDISNFEIKHIDN